MESKLIRIIEGIERDSNKTREEKDRAISQLAERALKKGYYKAYLTAHSILGTDSQENPYLQEILEREKAEETYFKNRIN